MKLNTRSILVLLLFLVFNNLNLRAQNAILAEANLVHETNYEKALSLYNQVLEIDPTNFEAIWSAAFLYTKIGNKVTNQSEKEVNFKKALELANKALEMQPNSVYSNYVFAVALGRMGDISSAKERVQNASVIKEHVELALKIDPNHAASWHILGKLNYRLHNLNFAEKAAAAILFGGLPKGVSTEKAVECFSKAVELRPDYILYRLDLSVALIKLGNKEEAKKVLNDALKIPSLTEDDPQYLKDCSSLLKRLN